MSSNYFELYEVPIAFFPDEKEIRNRYYQYSREFHPDHTGNDLDSVQKTSLNNAAYKTLKKFDSRLPYVLELEGVYQSDEKYPLDPEFLMEMMELNEEIAFSDDPADKEKLKVQVEKLEKEIHEQIETLCKKWDDTKDGTLLQEIKDLYYRRKYLKRLWQNINGEEAEL